MTKKGTPVNENGNRIMEKSMNRTFFDVALPLAILVGTTTCFSQGDIPGRIKAQAGGRVHGISRNTFIGWEAEMGKIEEDWFLFLRPQLNIDLGRFGLGLQVPLRIRIEDNDPEDEDDYGDLIRREDWDEPSDWLKAIKYIRYGYKGDPIHAVAGDLRSVSLGHGTIVHMYSNNLDINHFKMGALLDLDTEYFGVETIQSNIHGYGLRGGRAYVRPFGFFSRDPSWRRLAFGATYVRDERAPYTLEAKGGGPYLDPSNQVPAVDDEMNFKVWDRKMAEVSGVDAEYEVMDITFIRMLAYADYNRIRGGGDGFHTGVLGRIRIPLFSVELETRAEFRRLDGNYLPAYFGSHYEIQRYQFPFVDNLGKYGLGAGAEVTTMPKRRALESLENGTLKGYYGELDACILGLVTIGGSFDDYQGPYNSNLRLYAEVPSLEGVQLECYYLKSRFDEWKDAFTFDERSMFLLEAKTNVIGPLFLVARYWRIWELDEEEGRYEPVDDWSVGFGVKFRL